MSIDPRLEFNNSVRFRDKDRCVACGKTGVDVHHIIDRSLWIDGGYHADNGVLLCSDCHLKAEYTILSCKDLRQMAGIKQRKYPITFNLEDEYDHWGNTVEPSGVRYPGPLFYNENVQSALKHGNALDLLTWDIKYPRTHHFTYSPNVQNDDRMHTDDGLFEGKTVVGTIKMDGECTTMTRERVFARSVNSGPHPSRDWVHALHGSIKHDIPVKWRVCGENVYAEHSIPYKNLSSYFLVFSIWDDTNRCLSWNDTVLYAGIMGLETVPLFYQDAWCREFVDKAFEGYCKKSVDPVEGYVIRLADSFRYESFSVSTAKWVRKGHVTTNEHWLSQPVKPNGLRK